MVEFASRDGPVIGNGAGAYPFTPVTISHSWQDHISSRLAS